MTMNPKRSTAFTEWVRAARSMRGWTARVLAEKSGISEGYMSQLESVVRKPSRDTVERLAGALGIDPSAGLIAAGLVPAGELVATGPGAVTAAAYNNAPADIQGAVDRILDPWAAKEARKAADAERARVAAMADEPDEEE